MITKTLRAAIYARYSTDKQRAESLDDQYRVCEQVAAREGFNVIAKFGDKEISGGTADRPGYQAMLDAARLRKFDILICEDISRLWRNRSEFGTRSAELEDLHIHMVTAVGDDTRRSGWDMTIQVKLAMAEQARREASYRTRRGLDGLARAGKHAGGKAYGYLSVDKVRTIDVEQAKVVRQIFEWRADGWSAQRIARELNERKVPSPGSSWDRRDTGKNRKTKKGWRPSAIAGDHTRGVGILNNRMYRGEVIWGRSKWTRSAANSNIRTVSAVDAGEWVIHKVPSLRIVSDELWDAVLQVQTASTPRREAVKRGITKKASGHDSKYWLGTLLVCAECASNYIGNGTRDFVCPAHISNACGNNMRFRRDDANAAVFDVISRELLSDEQIEMGRQYIEQALKERQRQEAQASRDAVSGVDTKRLDAELKALRKMPLRPAAMAAAIEEIEKERAALLATANGKRDTKGDRATKLLDRMPEIVAAYRRQIQDGLKLLADDRVVHDAREATRRLLVGGRITLAPTAAHDAVTGPVHLVGLGEHVLELAGWQRKTRLNHVVSPNGSGGRI